MWVRIPPFDRGWAIRVSPIINAESNPPRVFAPSFNGLGHLFLKQVIGVRIPEGQPSSSFVPVAQLNRASAF